MIIKYNGKPLMQTKRIRTASLKGILLFLCGIYKGKWHIQMKISLYMEYRYACQSSV